MKLRTMHPFYLSHFALYYIISALGWSTLRPDPSAVRRAFPYTHLFPPYSTVVFTFVYEAL